MVKLIFFGKSFITPQNIYLIIKNTTKYPFCYKKNEYFAIKKYILQLVIRKM